LPAIAAYEHELLEYATAETAGQSRAFRQIGTAASKAGVLSFVVNGVESEKVGTYLDDHGIAVRAGTPLCATIASPVWSGDGRAAFLRILQYASRRVDVLIRALHQLPKR
jgi:cysteine desulfurase/selenocysteine lyase